MNHRAMAARASFTTLEIRQGPARGPIEPCRHSREGSRGLRCHLGAISSFMNETTARNAYPAYDRPTPMIGESERLRKARELLQRYAGCNAPVLIEGETGTGKELAAREIHYASARGLGPFVPLNCGALPDALLESELFGHRRGAFTDARSSEPGLVEYARGGSLFLDEIDSL